MACVMFQDDPLSAVDVHVAEQMFEKGIIELLLKQGRTVILATHHLRYLQQADMVQGCVYQVFQPLVEMIDISDCDFRLWLWHMVECCTRAHTIRYVRKTPT